MNRLIAFAAFLIVSFDLILSTNQAKNEKKIKDIESGNNSTATTLPANSTVSNKDSDLDPVTISNNTINTDTTATDSDPGHDCDPIYLRFSSNHTACKDYNHECNITKVRTIQ